MFLFDVLAVCADQVLFDLHNIGLPLSVMGMAGYPMEQRGAV